MHRNSQLNAVTNEINEDYSLYYTQAIDDSYAINGTFGNSEINCVTTQLKAVRLA